MSDIFITVAPVFFLIAVGAFLKVLKIADDKWIEVLNNFALYAGFPALIFTNLTSLNTGIENHYSLFLVNTGIIFSYMIVLFLITRIKNTKREISNCYILGAVFGNTAYMGYPYITSLISGSEMFISIIIASYIIVVFTVGLWILETSLDHSADISVIFRNIIRNPLLLSVVFGIIFAQIEIAIPVIIDKSLKMIGSAASPVVLVALGIFLVKRIEFNIKLVHAVSITSLKIIVLPAIFYLVFYLFKGENVSIPLLEAGMPTGITMFTLSQKYPLDNTVIVYLIVISTVLSMITLPVISLLIL